MRLPLLMVLLAALAGCGSGPPADALRKDAEARLAQALPSGTVTMIEFERRGSQSDTKAPSDETRRIIYFDAALKLDRDFDFGAWDSPGVAGLVSTFGTGPKGITGLASGGNKAGDLIRAHGTALYKRDANGWTAVVSGGYAPAAIPSLASAGNTDGIPGLLESMRKVLEAIPPDIPPVQKAVIEQELKAARVAVQAAVARASEGYALAAGPEHGQYYRFARALSNPEGTHVVALVTRGGEENLRLLRDGKVSMALSQADAALAAYEGKGHFAGDGPHATLRAIGSLYPEPVHVIVRDDSPIKGAADLAGRSIAVGPEGSASRASAIRVLEAHGLQAKTLRLLDLPLNESLVGLQQKQVDAVIQVIGAPADSVRSALAEVSLRLVPLSQSAVQTLVASNAGYVAYTIPRGAYSTQAQDVPTVATAALLLVGSGLTESEVGSITRYVYGKGQDFAARGSAQGTQVAAASARLGLSIPLHIAAARVLDSLTSKPAPEGATGGAKH